MKIGRTPEAGRHLILFDGVCGLCNRLVSEVLPRDPEGLFHFASLQSATSRSLLTAHAANPDDLDTVYVVEGYRSDSPRLLRRARAVLFVIAHLDSPWRSLKLFGVLPTFLLNAIYSVIARNRYRVFGKLDHCLVPTTEYASRFVDG